MQRVRIGLEWLRGTIAGLVNQAPSVAQSMVEYAIVAAIIAVIALTAVKQLNGPLTNAFANIGHNVEGAGQDVGASGSGH